MSNSTLLSINEINFSDYASRGIRQSLEIEDNGELERDCNGTLHDLTLPSHRKYTTTIECTDHEAPPLNGIYKGSTITVVCLPNLGVSDATDGTLTMTMMVTGWRTQFDEWEADVAWSLTAREI